MTKSASVLPKSFTANSTMRNEYIAGSRRMDTVLEYGHEFVSIRKQGNRVLCSINVDIVIQLAQYVDKSVLNTFCYSGAFSLCRKAGASMVHSWILH
jgi:hypothetical protein